MQRSGTWRWRESCRDSKSPSGLTTRWVWPEHCRLLKALYLFLIGGAAQCVTSLVLAVCLQDWRIHVDQMHQHKDGIRSSLKEAKVRSLTCCLNSDDGCFTVSGWGRRPSLFMSVMLTVSCCIPSCLCRATWTNCRRTSERLWRR